MNKSLRRWAPLLLLIAILLLWQLICTVFKVSEFIFPSPLRIVQQAWEHAGTIMGHAWRAPSGSQWWASALPSSWACCWAS